jgi:hypothetical protein
MRHWTVTFEYQKGWPNNRLMFRKEIDDNEYFKKTIWLMRIWPCFCLSGEYSKNKDKK